MDMTFEDFARSHGLILSHAIADGAWHRVATVDHQRTRNGAYCYRGDHGFVCNWATMEQTALWRTNERVTPMQPYPPPQARINRQRAQERARNEATRLLASAERGLHPYLARKGFPLLQGLVDPVSGDLLIPMRDCRDYSVVNSVQRIGADGSKKFLSGGKAKGSVFHFALGANTPLWLVEGWITGKSVAEAIKSMHMAATVLVCFSAGNLPWVAHQMSQRPAYVAADNDASLAGQKAAEATGLPWIMPVEVGTDFNDMHQAQGVRAVATMLRKCIEDHQQG